MLPEGAVAFTLGEHVFVARGIASQATLLHEAGHVLQYRRLGIPRFLLLYGWYSLRYGYELNPLEVEAYAFALDRADRFSFLENARFLHEL